MYLQTYLMVLKDVLRLCALLHIRRRSTERLYNVGGYRLRLTALDRELVRIIMLLLLKKNINYLSSKKLY